jgi:hypothetical protein
MNPPLGLKTGTPARERFGYSHVLPVIKIPPAEAAISKEEMSTGLDRLGQGDDQIFRLSSSMI